MFTLETQSDSFPYVYVNLLRGIATVEFNDGTIYRYNNVSRRAISNFMSRVLSGSKSCGSFVNSELVHSNRAYVFSAC